VDELATQDISLKQRPNNQNNSKRKFQNHYQLQKDAFKIPEDIDKTLSGDSTKKREKKQE
jgi:hypothetical protein